ncbi:hypothetical protein [Sphingobium yanoikuyae]|uniref:hypothetical protein n=1 Tax=Sphingobium yanoikuyae TaxID=13690 RepID=UPI0011100DE5|nr:hypothetical protein [Sphingobium yanoikuyae]
MDWRNLRGGKAAVKRGKSHFAAFERACIKNATRRNNRNFTPAKQDNFVMTEMIAAMLHLRAKHRAYYDYSPLCDALTGPPLTFFQAGACCGDPPASEKESCAQRPFQAYF